ncbi:uncharacterized protein LOC129768086 [Toxorhynchites rutilus septentrionalis]|uniref:uncharacterized protein LOC129768086 n=1 Tax=Toxorhynchites rutilus septentrionalis TaxID=329112 RepID=UPI00247B2B3A|nr:uncharacterized protein LOC129768086 [Toxorhynchites rutilus septentrionalis]
MKRFIALLTLVTLAQTLSIDDRTLEINVNVEKNANNYHNSQLGRGSFEYGLDVVKQADNHFQHKVRGPDGVTYGCYGFVDPDGKPHLVHYVSDIKGYRVVPPDHATKIYISRVEKSIDNVYQGSVERNVQWKDLFFPPACSALFAELTKNAPSTTPRPTTPRPTTRPTTRSTTTRTTTTPLPIEPEFPDSSNVHESIIPHQLEPACSSVCEDLKRELEEIKNKLNRLLDAFARKEADEAERRRNGAGGKFAYFPVMLSDGVPDGLDTGSSKIAYPAFGQQQCGTK